MREKWRVAALACAAIVVLSIVVISSCGDNSVKPASVQIINLPKPGTEIPIGVEWTNQFGVSATDTGTAYFWQAVAVGKIPSGGFSIDDNGRFRFTATATDSNHIYTFRVLLSNATEIVASIDFPVTVTNWGPLVLQIDRVANAGTSTWSAVSVKIAAGRVASTSFELLVGYDSSGLDFISAGPGDALSATEYALYDINFSTGITGLPPSLNLDKYVRVQVDYSHHSLVPPRNPLRVGDELVKLSFWVKSCAKHEHLFHPVSFLFEDCGDNGFTLAGDSTLVPSVVYSSGWSGAFNDQSGRVSEDPCLEAGPIRVGGYCETSCKNATGGAFVPDAIAWNGGVEVALPECCFCLGDVNGDGTVSMGDVFDMINYKLHARDFLSSDPEIRQLQLIASDVNLDGLPLTIADPVYLMNYIFAGNPYPHETVPFRDTVGVERTERGLALHSDIGVRYIYLKIISEQPRKVSVSLQAEVRRTVTADTVLIGVDPGNCRVLADSAIVELPTDAEIREIEISDCIGYLLYPEMTDSR